MNRKSFHFMRIPIYNIFSLCSFLFFSSFFYVLFTFSSTHLTLIHSHVCLQLPLLHFSKVVYYMRMILVCGRFYSSSSTQFTRKLQKLYGVNRAFRILLEIKIIFGCSRCSALCLWFRCHQFRPFCLSLCVLFHSKDTWISMRWEDTWVKYEN